MADNTERPIFTTRFGTLLFSLAYYFGIEESEMSDVLSEANTTIQAVFDRNKDYMVANYTATQKNPNNQDPPPSPAQADIDVCNAATKIVLDEAVVNAARKVFNVKVWDKLDAYVSKAVNDVVNRTVSSIISNTLRKGVAKPHSHGIGEGETRETDPQIRVLVMSRSTTENGKGKLINISPFIFNGNVSVGDNGGNFSFDLDPVMVDNSLKNAWSAQTASGNVIKNGSWLDEYASDSSTHRTVVARRSMQVVATNPKDLEGAALANKVTNLTPIGFERIRNEMLMNMLISPQDVVFIKFGLLQMEVAFAPQLARPPLQPLQEITLAEVQYDNFEMIGLVDRVGESGRVGSATMMCEVKGRDLMKLMIEDGTYFFPVAKGNEAYEANLFGNISNDPNDLLKDRVYQRFFGELKDVMLYTKQPLNKLLPFIYKKMNTIDVFPDSSFVGVVPSDPNSFGIWKMTELTVDESAGNRYLADSGLRTAQGSILSFMQSVCQKPFVEFYGDTYGNKYHFIARRPPFEYDDILNLWNAAGKPTIDESDIYDHNLDMDDSDVATWYRLNPEAFFYGNKQANMWYFPAIFLKEYAEVWGSKKKEFSHRYMAEGVSDSNEERYRNAYADLKYILNTHLMLPFTRKGTITTKNIRSIKKGTWIYVSGSDEICYVDNIGHSFNINNDSVDGETNISVSRCMKLRHLNKYFQLMQFPPVQNFKERKVDWRVNKAVFDFFVQKKQFIS